MARLNLNKLKLNQNCGLFSCILLVKSGFENGVTISSELYGGEGGRGVMGERDGKNKKGKCCKTSWFIKKSSDLMAKPNALLLAS